MTLAQQDEHPFEPASESVMTRTPDGMIKFWNHHAEKLYGWKKEEAIGRVSHDLLKTQFPKQLQEIESELVRAGRWEGKLVHTTRDGGRVVVESRWILELEGHAGAVTEVNRPFPEPAPVPASRTLDDVLARTANIVLGAGAFFCALVVLHSLYRQFWTGDRELTGVMGVVVYHLLPACLAGLLLASLWLPPPVRIRLAILLFSTGLSTYGVETAMTVWMSLPSVGAKHTIVERARVAEEWGVKFDRRTTLEVVRDLRKKGVEAYPAVPAAMLVKVHGAGGGLLPLAGISNKVSVLCNEAGEYVIYESDEHGFHNPKGLWNTPVDIAAVGDSYVHGDCVPSAKNFVAFIRNEYPATLNLGIAGQGPIMTLATMKEYLPFLKPRVVLWFFYEGNDLLDLARERTRPVLMRYLEDGFTQDLVRRQAEIDHRLATYVNAEMGRSELSRRLEEIAEELGTPGRLLESARSAVKLGYVRGTLGLIGGQRNINRQASSRKGDLTEEVRHLFPRVIAQAKAVVSEWGGELYFVYLPGWSTDPDIIRDDQEEVMRAVRTLEVPIIEVQRAFQTHPDPGSLFPFRVVGHYNEAGQRVVATEVLRKLDQSPARP